MNTFTARHVTLVGGGTGGHMYPLIAIAEELGAATIPSVVSYLGPNTDYDRAFKELGVSVHHIPGSKLRRYTALSNFLDVFKFALGLIKALITLYILMPDIVLVKGGPGSLAAAFAARFYRIKIVVHESDAFPSLTTRLLARNAYSVLTSFPGSEAYLKNKNTRCIGNPVRAHLFTETLSDKEAMKATFGFDPGKPLLLIIGGSQGAQFLNSFILDNMAALLAQTQILHQTGKANFPAIELQLKDFLAEPKNRSVYQVRPYLENEALREALTAADLVVTRAGASALFEIALMKMPAIVVPIADSANNHQRHNANHYESAGAGIVLEEQNMKIHLFLNQLDKLLKNETTRQSMVKACEAFSKPKAAKEIADTLLNTTQ